MSVLITVKVTGDTAAFRQAVTERADEFAKIGESARGFGAIHHRFGVGDGYVLAVDEWESPERSGTSSATLTCSPLSARSAATPPSRPGSASPTQSSQPTSSEIAPRFGRAMRAGATR
jgi:hypothetical protein